MPLFMCESTPKPILEQPKVNIDKTRGYRNRQEREVTEPQTTHQIITHHIT
jgi:hypothetical protein